MQCSAWGTKAQKKLTWRKDAGTLGSQGHWGAGESCCWPTWTLPRLQGRPPAGLASSLQLVTPHSLFCVRLCADGLQQCHLGGWAFLVALRWLRDRLQCWRPGFDPWVRKIPWWREWLPTVVFLPGKSHGQRSLVDYSPWGCEGLDMTEPWEDGFCCRVLSGRGGTPYSLVLLPHF